MSIYLISFYPICCTTAGLRALDQYKIDPYIDGSCRREPDFKHPFPAVTGLCRPGFSKALRKGDIIIYVTNKRGIGVNRFISILEVVEKKNSHREAAEWYLKNKPPLPNNLIVKETEPFPLDQTHRIMGWDSWNGKVETLDDWDKGYEERAENFKEVAICKIWNNHLYRNDPIELSKKDKMKIFKRVPNTRNYVRLNPDEWARFQSWIITKIVRK